MVQDLGCTIQGVRSNRLFRDRTQDNPQIRYPDIRLMPQAGYRISILKNLTLRFKTKDVEVCYNLCQNPPSLPKEETPLYAPFHNLNLHKRRRAGLSIHAPWIQDKARKQSVKVMLLLLDGNSRKEQSLLFDLVKAFD